MGRVRSMTGVVVLMVAALLAACGNGDEGSSPEGAGPTTVEIVMLDDLSFEPSSLEVSVGQAVRFVVTNEGEITHDFSLGDAAEHGEEGEGHETGETVVLEPGETGELTYTFDEAGTVEFGCHQPGHFEAGMVFTARVA